jgi:hypothetical protein
MSQRKRDDRCQIPTQPIVRQCRARGRPAGGVETVAIADQVAGSGDNGLGMANLCLGGLAVELDQQDSDCQAGDQRQAPKAE